MKNILVVLFGMAIAGQALADVDVAAGVKLYGVLDQAVQSQALTDSISTTAGQKYVGMYAAVSTSRLGVRAERELSATTKAHIQIEIELKACSAPPPTEEILWASVEKPARCAWARKKPWPMKHLPWMPMAAPNTNHSCGA